MASHNSSYKLLFFHAEMVRNLLLGFVTIETLVALVHLRNNKQTREVYHV